MQELARLLIAKFFTTRILYHYSRTGRTEKEENREEGRKEEMGTNETGGLQNLFFPESLYGFSTEFFIWSVESSVYNWQCTNNSVLIMGCTNYERLCKKSLRNQISSGSGI